MRFLICSSDPDDRKLAAFAARSFPSPAEYELIADSVFSRSYKKKAQASFVYFDAAMGIDRVLDLASKLDGMVGTGWGVLDRAGEAPDPSAFFFAGACDYVGLQLFKAGLDPERVDQTLVFAGLIETENEEAEADSFPGWQGLKEGSEVPVRFCYAAVGNQKALLERIGEKRLDKLREDFAAFLEPWSKECGGIVWIRESAGCLVLFPPRDEGKNPVLAALRLLVDRAIVGYEVFKLEVPLTFRFAFHAGHTMWRKPGATGGIVADDVNFIFHLGMKATADGSIYASKAASDDVPACISDLFSPAGEFEGRALIASRKFKD